MNGPYPLITLEDWKKYDDEILRITKRSLRILMQDMLDSEVKPDHVIEVTPDERRTETPGGLVAEV